MAMNCYNQAAIFIARNSTFHEGTKYIKIYCNYIWDKVMSGVISTTHVASSLQLADIFTKSLAKISYDAPCTKIDMFDLYVPS